MEWIPAPPSFYWKLGSECKVSPSRYPLLLSVPCFGADSQNLQAPSLSIQSPLSPLSTASLLSPSQGGSPTLTPGRDWWNHWVETDCDSTRWAGFDRVDSEQLLSGGRGGEGEGGGGNPRARADP